jgi:UDP:flavonoid glycosyltransferase YjiC (YdhE family)
MRRCDPLALDGGPCRISFEPVEMHDELAPCRSACPDIRWSEADPELFTWSTSLRPNPDTRSRPVRTLIHSIGSAGHVLPLVSLGLAARAGGQDVLFAVEEPLVGFPERAGFETISLPTTSAAENPRRAVEEIARRQALVGPARASAVQEMFVERSRAGMNTLAGVIDEYQPRVILRDQAAYAAWALGAARGIPVACFSFFPRPLAALRSLIDDLLAELLRSAGAPSGAPLEPALHIVGGPPGWFPPEIFDSHTLMIRPPVDVGEDRDSIPDAVRNLPHPRVYVSFGTVGRETGFLHLVLDALFQAGATILTTGASSRQDMDRVHHYPWLPQLPLMEHVDAVVAHGGYGTIMTALTAGVPVLSIHSR